MTTIRLGPDHRERVAVVTLVILAALQLAAIALAHVANAVTACAYNLSTNTINVTIDPGESAALAVAAGGVPDAEAPEGAILFNDNGAGFEGGDDTTQCESATVTNTVAIVVLGADGTQIFTIDNLAGGEFATSISWAIDLGSDSGDTLILNAGNGDDAITLGAGSFTLNGGLGQIAGTLEIQVVGNEGNDTIDASAATTSVTLLGSGGADTLTGGVANDGLGGGDGDDRLLGGPGDDRLDGGENVDRLYGGDGTDICFLGRASAPCEPSIAVEPATVAAGEPLTVRGANWYPENGDVEFLLVPPEGGEPQPLATPSLEDWSIEGTVTAPSTGGDYTLIACQPCGDPAADRPASFFTVLGATAEPTISVEPATALPGTSVLVMGERWDPENGPVSLFAELPDVPAGDSFATVTPNENGHIEYELPLGDLAAGSYVITACQLCGATDAIEQTTSFTVQAGTAPTFRLLPPTGAPGESLQAIGEGWDPDRGRVRVFVDRPSTGDEPDATARVLSDGTFEVPVVVPAIDDGAYTVIACQRCKTPNPIQVTATLTVSSAVPPPDPSPLPWILSAAGAVLVLAVGGGLLARRVRPPKQPPVPPEVRLVTAEPTVSVVADDDGATKHEIRLIPHADPGVQRIREGSPR